MDNEKEGIVGDTRCIGKSRILYISLSRKVSMSEFQSAKGGIQNWEIISKISEVKERVDGPYMQHQEGFRIRID